MNKPFAILVIDDDPLIRRFMEKVLAPEGYSVLQEDGPGSGLERAAREKPDLVVLDYHMPGMNGVELCRSMKKNLPIVPVIVATGDDDRGVRIECIKAGADDFLSKPLDVEELKLKTRNLVKMKRLHEATRSELEAKVAERTLDLEATNARLREEIAEKERIRASLEESERRYRRFVENLNPSYFFYSHDADGVFTYVSPSIENILGYAQEEFLTHFTEYLTDNPENEKVIEFTMMSLNGMQAPTYEVEIRRRDGKAATLEVTETPVMKDGRVTAVEGLARDVTERKKGERALRLFKAAIDQAAEAILITDAGGRIEYVNPAFERISGYSREEAVGRSSTLVKSGSHGAEFYRKLWETVSSGEIWSGRFVNRKKDGSLHQEDSTIAPIRDERGRIVNYVQVKRDVTQETLLEAQLRQALKLEAIGQLAAGIAHEINTPMQYVGDNVRFLKDGFEQIRFVLDKVCDCMKAVVEGKQAGPDDAALVREAMEKADLDYMMEEIPAAVEQALEGIDRVTKIARSMKEFAHPAGHEMKPANLNRAVENTVTVSRNEWKYVADLELKLDETLPPVPCLEGELNQTLLNLIVNAAHAIGDAIDRERGERGKIVISTLHAGDRAEIRVSDTGAGIPENIRDSIFTPFFTTKEVGRGTGQGLAIARSMIVDKHGGSLDFETEAGRGTTFIIRLPIGGPPGPEPERARALQTSAPAEI